MRSSVTGVSEADVDLAEAFAALARKLLAHDADVILGEIVGSAVSLIDPCEHASIDVIERREIRPVASSSPTAARVAEIQAEVDEGPCFSAIREHETFSTDDLATDARWPRFAARVAEETGIRSIIGYRLFVEGHTMGALNLYSTSASAFDHEAAAIGAVLAAHAAVAMSSERERHHLLEAVDTRDVIGQAKGILMARDDLSADEAFDILRRASQRLNVKLVDVAGQIANGTDEDAEPA